MVLHRDASVPIIVEDIDGDGDSDIMWGRGHDVGSIGLNRQETATPVVGRST